MSTRNERNDDMGRGAARGSEEPGDQVIERPAADDAADASSRDLGRSLDNQANVAGGQWADARPDDADTSPGDAGR